MTHRETKAGAGKLECAAAENLLGDTLRGAGPARAAEAQAAYRSCLAVRERLLGLHHPDVAIALLGEFMYRILTNHVELLLNGSAASVTKHSGALRALIAYPFRILRPFIDDTVSWQCRGGTFHCEIACMHRRGSDCFCTLLPTDLIVAGYACIIFCLL